MLFKQKKTTKNKFHYKGNQMLVNGFLGFVFCVAVIQATRVSDEFFQEVRDLLERKQSPQEEFNDGNDESNEVQSDVSNLPSFFSFIHFRLINKSRLDELNGYCACLFKCFFLVNLQQYRYQNVDSPPKPREIKDWPKVKTEFGQITAVAINPDGNPVIFHRADRIWKAE